MARLAALIGTFSCAFSFWGLIVVWAKAQPGIQLLFYFLLFLMLLVCAFGTTVLGRRTLSDVTDKFSPVTCGFISFFSLIAIVLATIVV